MARETAGESGGDFRIPTDLLKMFESEVRFIPRELHPNGYIMFDRVMLKRILLSNDLEARKQLVAQLEQLEKAGGRLAIVAR